MKEIATSQKMQNKNRVVQGKLGLFYSSASGNKVVHGYARSFNKVAFLTLVSKTSARVVHPSKNV